MAINDWWADDPNERYWIEITDRQNLGDNVIAPQLAGSLHVVPGLSNSARVLPASRAVPTGSDKSTNRHVCPLSRPETFR